MRMKERFGGSSGSSGSQDINISCKAGKAGLAIFRKTKGCVFATFNGRGPKYKSPQRDANPVDTCTVIFYAH